MRFIWCSKRNSLFVFLKVIRTYAREYNEIWKKQFALDPVQTYPDIFESATFSFRIKKFPRPHVSGFILIPTPLGVLATEHASCARNLLLAMPFSGSILLCHRMKKYPDLVSWRFRIHSVLKISTVESRFKKKKFICRVHRICVDGSRIRKENLRIQKISGYVWTYCGRIDYE